MTLESWQKLNVASFLASSIAIKFPETHGKAFVNAFNFEYLPLIKHPILIYKAESNAEIQRAFNRAKEDNLILAFILSLCLLQKMRMEIILK